MTFRIYRAPGWHSEPSDPLVAETDDEREAALLAGRRSQMPGGAGGYMYYAVGGDGELLDPIDAFECVECGDLDEINAAVAVVDGEVVADAGAFDASEIEWTCSSCASTGACWQLVDGECECAACEAAQDDEEVDA